MPLNERQLLLAYYGLIKAYPEDLHIARPLIKMLQARGEKEAARDLAMMMARRMLALGQSGSALAFLSICEQLEHPDADEISSMKTMAELTLSEPGQSFGDSKDVFSLIESLSDTEAYSFLKQAALLHVKKGETIVKQGEVSRKFYLILDGEMHVYIDTKDGHRIDLVVLKRGNFFGEFACVYQLPRSASVIADSEARLLEFSDTTVSKLMDYSPLAGDSLMKVVQKRMIESVSFSHPAFSEVAAEDRAWLEEDAELIEYAPGEKIGQEGQFERDAIYILAFGRAVVRRKIPNGKELSYEADPNMMYGDATLYLRFPADTEIFAMDRCLAFKIPLEIFDSFFNAYGGFGLWAENYALQRDKAIKSA